MEQQQKPSPTGTPNDAAPATADGQQRRAPESDTILKELETASKASTKQESFEKRKRRILEKCGCL